MLYKALDALERQSRTGFQIVVVDQSDVPDEGLRERAEADGGLRLVRDQPPGLSRARNVGWRETSADWVVFIDDDCIAEADWAEQLDRAIGAHPDAAFVAGDVYDNSAPDRDYLTVSSARVLEERVRSGRWVRPWDIGVGAFMGVRREVIEDLGGWDARLGPGARDFPAADDMDFNYRFLKSGGTALATPRARVLHDQWRTPDELGPLYRRYIAAWSGFAMKHLRTGDVLGGLWLWQLGLRDVLRLFASALRRRSGLRLRVSLFKLQGLVLGTVKGVSRSW